MALLSPLVAPLVPHHGLRANVDLVTVETEVCLHLDLG